MVSEEDVGLEQQVVEVYCTVRVEQLLVSLVQLANGPFHRVGVSRSVGVRLYQLALGGGDGGEQRPWREALGVDLKLLHPLLE